MEKLEVILWLITLVIIVLNSVCLIHSTSYWEEICKFSITFSVVYIGFILITKVLNNQYTLSNYNESIFLLSSMFFINFAICITSFIVGNKN